MALSKKITKTDNFGKNVELDCYIKVSAVNATKDEALASAAFMESATGRLYFSETYKFQIDMDGDNPFRQAYKHLKTLPEFEGAIDC
jgi:hypothetical protein